MAALGHKHSASLTINQKAQLANAYNELGKELSSQKLRVVGNYTLGKVIGEGSFGTVRMGTHRLTATRVAIKQIPKAMSAQLTREIHHHRRLHHPHVTQLYEIIATEGYIWLVTELCSGGELYDYLIEKSRLSEDEARISFGQLCLAVGYIHDKGVVHRDLKLENVLLDERCRVKLSDFGFTREYERGAFLETWCGTTGYASPEMLLCQKYQGQEVDVWSLGVILFALLTGSLPFDDDDEAIQKANIIRCELEVPEWLSSDAQDLIHKILQRDPTKRLAIPQILSHAWFMRPNVASPLSVSAVDNHKPAPIDEEQNAFPEPVHFSVPSTSSSSTYTTFHSATSEFSYSTPPTPDEDLLHSDNFTLLRHNFSQSTITKPGVDADGALNLTTPVKKPVAEEPFSSYESSSVSAPFVSPPSPSNGKMPPGQPTRTPARTKRRSVSSVLSAPSSPTSPEHASPQPPQDFISTLSTPAPIVFSTPLERELLNNLSALGFDTGQMVHSVLTDACDSSGAVWWMMRRKAERRALEEATQSDDAKFKGLNGYTQSFVPGTRTSLGLSESSDIVPDETTIAKQEMLVATPSSSEPLNTPDLDVVPPSPTAKPTLTPPRVTSPVLLSPPTLTPSQSQTLTEPQLQPRSNISSPSSSQGSKGRTTKPRSGSVSIMQRATTALEAAGLVRKKSEEKVRKEDHDRDKDRDREKENHRVRDKEDKEKRTTSAEESRTSGGSNKLTKSPPFRPSKDGVLNTPDNEPSTLVSGLPPASPWVIPAPVPSSSHIAPTPANSPGEVPVMLPQSSSISSVSGKQHGRARASILHTFRMWFHEDRKGKRKVTPPNPQHALHTMTHPIASPASTGSVHGGRHKRRSGSNSGIRRGHQKRPSVSSRRSSSVNSRRSSIASAQKVPMDYQLADDPFNSRRRSFGARTPTSERGEHHSRPSSLRSFQVSTPGIPPAPVHRQSHSPSESSTGSGRRSLRRTDSPLQRYHRRGGSGSSTRVVRQVKTVHPHVRSSSAASSHHSAPSSRPASYHEASETEPIPRTGSPLRTLSRQSNDETPRRAPYSTTVLVAKKPTSFKQPTLGRSSWKKSWGVEPPGWKSRSTEAPFEVLFTDDPRTSVRDVFSGRQSLNLGDEDDWVDEDDDIPFAGGLGQMPSTFSHANTSTSLEPYHKPEPLVLSPPPRSAVRPPPPTPMSKRNGTRSTSGRQKPSHSPVAGTSPLPTMEHGQSESRNARRQLPGRAEPAFRHPIQEEDEGEEEE